MDKNSKEYRAYRREISRQYRQKHYNKVLARSYTSQLAKKPCVECAKSGVINEGEWHHWLGYDHPYKVIPLCKKHHEEADTALAREGKEG